jgi:protein-disulfide isomerase
MSKLAFALPTIVALALAAPVQTSAQTSPASTAKKAAAKGAATKSLPTKPASSATAAGTLPTKAEIDSFMHHQFGYDPNAKWTIESVVHTEMPGVSRVILSVGDKGGQTSLLVMPGNKNAIVGQYDIIPFGADPFADAASKLKTSITGPRKGTANAKLTIVEFSDLQCPFCKQSQPVIDRLLQEIPDARLVFQNFPLESVHKWALKAARFDDCVAQQGTPQFWKFIQGVYDAQSDITEANVKEKLTTIANAAGADGAKAATCIDSTPAIAHVSKSQDLGRTLGVNSTPTVFLNGRKITNVRDVPFDQLKAIAEFEKKQP